MRSLKIGMVMLGLAGCGDPRGAFVGRWAGVSITQLVDPAGPSAQADGETVIVTDPAGEALILGNYCQIRAFPTESGYQIVPRTCESSKCTQVIEAGSLALRGSVLTVILDSSNATGCLPAGRIRSTLTGSKVH